MPDDSQRAEQAFAIHAALLRAERDDAALADIPWWRRIRRLASGRWFAAWQLLDARASDGKAQT